MLLGKLLVSKCICQINKNLYRDEKLNLQDYHLIGAAQNESTL